MVGPGTGRRAASLGDWLQLLLVRQSPFTWFDTYSLQSRPTFAFSALIPIKTQHVFTSGGARKGFNVDPEGETIQVE
jgi:hypothetical protein